MTLPSLTHQLLVGAVACFVFASCTTPQVQPRRRAVRGLELNSTLSPEAEQHILTNTGSEFGKPEKLWNFGRTDYVTRPQYVLEHSAFDRIPLWVAHYLPATQIDGPAPDARRPGWRNEPQLDAAVRADNKLDYKPFTAKSSDPYDRGHMTPNADFETAEGRKSTFFLSNVVPQAKQNNQRIWNALEALIRKWVLRRGEAYIVTGPMFYDPLEEDPNTADGIINYQVIGANEVAVPTHLFKVVMARTSTASDAGWQAISFVFENRKYSKVNGKYPFAEGLRSIDWIEERTGLNLFPKLDASPIALQIEAATPTALWSEL